MPRGVRPEPGHRPRGRFAAGRCRWCGAGYILDREVQPWARARTCSTSCAKHLANHGRTSATCEHCLMVERYHDTRAVYIEQAGGWRNEQAADGAVVFGEWLRRYEWPSAEAELLGVAS